MNDAISQYLGTTTNGRTSPFQSNSYLYIDFMTPVSSRAFAYSHLYSVAFDGSIELTFTEHVVVLDGENLDRLYLAIQQHAVDRVVSVDELHAKSADVPGYVTSIDIRPITEDAK